MGVGAFVVLSWGATRSTSSARRLCRCCSYAERKRLRRISASGPGFEQHACYCVPSDLLKIAPNWAALKGARAAAAQHKGSGASADNSLRSAAEALKGTLVNDGKRLEIGHFCFAACGSSIRQEVFAGPKSPDAPEPAGASDQRWGASAI